MPKRAPTKCSLAIDASMALARDFYKETTRGTFWFAHIFYFFLGHAFIPEKARVIAPHIS